MWSIIYLLLNKFLKADDGDVEKPAETHLNFGEPYTIQPTEKRFQHRDCVLSHFVKVPHISQQQTWDCGLACVLMVLRVLGVYNCDIQELGELCQTTSIWTVDLAYLLQKFSVSFTYNTVTLGANPDFGVQTFYKEQLPNDLVRVNILFQEAREFGIYIECRSISAKEISEFILSGKYIAIALIDHYKLSNSRLKDAVRVSNFYSGVLGYIGHYIVICGYDTVKNEFEIRDPASSRKREWVTSCSLDQARKSFGTDEDLLLISLEKAGNKVGGSSRPFSL